jgi:hypothetical protein
MDLGVKIRRDSKHSTRPLIEIFRGFEKIDAVKSIFGEETERVLSKMMLVVEPREGYLYVDSSTGNIVISSPYLESGDEKHIYLDVIHELVHVRQFMEGKELFDKRYSYVDRPTEIEAYSHAVREAKRIGMTEKEIVDYLRVEWVTEKQFERLVRRMGIEP